MPTIWFDNYRAAQQVNRQKGGNMKKVLVSAVALSMLVGGYLTFSTVDSETPVAVAAKKTYNTTAYVAGMGGHFAVVDLTIDPNDTKNPLKVNSLEMLDIGGPTHATHDARIDSKNRNLMFWSTYKNVDGKNFVGKSDLTTGKVLADVAIPVDKRVTWSGANYCGSGQSEKYFLPVHMGNEGYIDVIDKETMKLKHRVFWDDLGIKSGEVTFAHGINTPDMKHFLISLNHTPTGHLQWTGNNRLILVDMKELVEKGKLKKVAETMITGKPKDAVSGTITFRQYFSEDGKLLFQSGGDRGYVIDAKTLKVLDVATPLPGEAHDMMPTPDAKYALLPLRQKAGETMDGTLALYDVEAKKMIGNTVSVCLACHNDAGVKGNAILCGMDANYR
jgi:hypothetical protein